MNLESFNRVLANGADSSRTHQLDDAGRAEIVRAIVRIWLAVQCRTLAHLANDFSDRFRFEVGTGDFALSDDSALELFNFDFFSIQAAAILRNFVCDRISDIEFLGWRNFIFVSYGQVNFRDARIDKYQTIVCVCN